MINSIPGIPEPHSSKILELFHTATKTPKAILFGSRAKGNFREGSDIDIALKGTNLTLDDRDQLLRRFEALDLPWKLDIVIYSLVSEPALKEHIDRMGLELK